MEPELMEGIRVYSFTDWSEMYCQSTQASQEEEDQEGDQDSAEFGWRT